MNKSFIVDQMWSLQKDYHSMLKTAVEQIDSSDFSLVLDEITLFWYSKREVIKLILNYISHDYDCYLFTGAAYLNVEDNEHLPFALFGDIRIIDDPLNRFTTMPSEIANAQFHEKITSEIKNTIIDSIKVIEDTKYEFAILPVTQVSDIENEVIKQGTEKAFWGLFEDQSMDYKKYHEEIETIDQLKSSLRSDIIDRIVFSSVDDNSSSFEEKFREYRKEVSPIYDRFSDSMAFYYIMSGFFSQALNTLMTCLQFNFTPYLRYKVSFHYSMLVGSIFSESKEIRHMLNKATIAHICYYEFDNEFISDFSFDKYISYIRENQICNELISVMKKNSEECKYLLQDVLADIDKILKKVYLFVEQ